MCCILKIRDLYQFDYDLFLVNMAVIDQNVVRLDIYKKAAD